MYATYCYPSRGKVWCACDVDNGTGRFVTDDVAKAIAFPAQKLKTKRGAQEGGRAVRIPLPTT